jgi:hypothetical protein
MLAFVRLYFMSAGRTTVVAHAAPNHDPRSAVIWAAVVIYVLGIHCHSPSVFWRGMKSRAKIIQFEDGGAIMAQHAHRFTIADDDAVRVLVGKLVKGGGKQGREKLLRALDDAARHYKDSNQKVRQAFFHGLLTGYAVALKLR